MTEQSQVKALSPEMKQRAISGITDEMVAECAQVISTEGKRLDELYEELKAFQEYTDADLLMYSDPEYRFQRKEVRIRALTIVLENRMKEVQALVDKNMVVHCHEHLQEMREFADRHDKRAAFEQVLGYVASYPDVCDPTKGIKVHLYSDIGRKRSDRPLDFSWVAKNDQNPPTFTFCGGLNLHYYSDGDIRWSSNT